ncbi:hypothetical protein [Kocuria rosea]|uniref:hypothetical protein n=1 Tax=Kocuria rosea TaxID=1275 RepID=UPI0030161E81
MRDEMVRLARTREVRVALAQMSEDIENHEMMLSKWMRQADVEDGEKLGATINKSAENRKLKKRIRLLG